MYEVSRTGDSCCSGDCCAPLPLFKWSRLSQTAASFAHDRAELIGSGIFDPK